MKKILICIVMLCIVGVVFAEKATELKELLNPKKIFVQGDRLLTVEPTTISIYSLKDYKLIKKFGKAGEGPQEFKINPTSGFPTVKVCLTSDAIFVTSIGRLSIFTPDGEFVKMENIGPDLQEVHPFADKFIGWTTGLKKKFDYWILNLYSSDSNKLKELYAVKNTYQATEGLKVLSRSLRFQVYKDKFFVSGNPEFDISVFDTKGNPLPSIKREYQRVKVTKDMKEGLKNWLKNAYKTVFDRFKIIYPEYLPAVREFVVSDGKLYAITNRKKKNLTECFIFDLNGKLLKETFIPVVYEDIIRVYPFTVKGDSLYQLVSNDDTEEWELHVTPIR